MLHSPPCKCISNEKELQLARSLTKMGSKHVDSTEEAYFCRFQTFVIELFQHAAAIHSFTDNPVVFLVRSGQLVCFDLLGVTAPQRKTPLTANLLLSNPV